MATHTVNTVQERIVARSGNATVDAAAATYFNSVEDARAVYNDALKGNPTQSQINSAVTTLNASLDAARSVYLAALKAAGV